MQKFFYLTIVMLSLISVTSLALNSDHEQPITINAERAECQQKTLFCSYSGDVKFIQGSSYLGAPKVLIYRNDANGIEKIVASGDPAYFHTVLDHALFNNKQKQMLIKAQAETIEIYPIKSLIVLMGKAQITQERNKFNAEHIEYDINKGTILSKPSNNSRTIIVLQPQGK